MKKLYTILAAAAVVLSASAQELQKAAEARTLNTTKAVMATKAIKAADVATKAPAKEAAGTTLADLAGEYIWNYNSNLQSSSGAKTASMFIEIENEATGEVAIDLDGWDVTATYDAATKVLSIPANQDLGYNAYNDIQVYLYHRRWNSNGQGAVELNDPFLLTFDGAQLVWPEINGTGSLAGQQFKADIVAIGNSSKGWFVYGDDNQMTKYVEVPDTRTWTNVGTAEFTDGWFLPFIGEDQNEYPYNVAVEQCVEDPATYRLVNPYQIEDAPAYYAGYNTCTEPGYIEFNLSDSEHPYFNAVKAGLTLASAGVQNMYCYNTLGFIMGYNNITKDVAVPFMEQQGFGFSVLDDNNVLTLPSTFVNAEDGYENDALFGILGDVWAGYGWNSQTGASADMTVKIALPSTVVAGIADVAVDTDANNAPVEYFNLQGIRINEPAAGQVVIRRQGKDTKKLFVK